MQLTYNNITFSYTATQSVEQTPVFEDSGTDQIATRIAIHVRAVLAANVVPAQGSETPTQTAARIRAALMKKRQQLSIKDAAGNVLAAVVNPPDERNGPTPLYCTVESALEGSFVVSYGIEAFLPACPDGGRPPYLALRWDESASYDSNWRLTKRRSGVLIVSGADRINPDDLRGLVIPGIDPGFRREANYQLDKDGLVYRFDFTDRELMRPAPWPLTVMKGRMIETCPTPGATRYGSIMLRGEFPKGVPHKEAFNALVRIAVHRALATGLKPGAGDRMTTGHSIVEVLDDDVNAVEFTLNWMMKTTRIRENGSADATAQGLGNAVGQALQLGLFGIPGMAGGTLQNVPNADGRNEAALPVWAGWIGAPIPGSDPSRSIAPPSRGTAERVKLVAAALGDPCGQTVQTNDLVGTNEPPFLTPGSTTINELRTYYTPDSQDALFTDDSPGVYDHYVVTLHANYDGGNAVCPSTKAGEKAAEVQVCNETLSLTVEWSAKRVGGLPIIPTYKPTNPNIVGVGRTVSPQGVDLAADGVSFVYSISGQYRYEVLDLDEYDPGTPIPPHLFESSHDVRLIQGESNDVLWGELHGDPDHLLGGVQP